ncbi:MULTISPECIES: hypothetical protein [Streptomyces]|uniref:hypothetical protein n=1 Tax=Streptomyces TaxID=1883 RepID=UPI000CD54D59|nr:MULTISPECIES: hypothetical protein [Streptomyces]
MARRELRGRAAVLLYCGCAAAVVLMIAVGMTTGATVAGWAGATPGGPAVFLSLLGLATAAAVLLTAYGCLVCEVPERAAWSGRFGRWVPVSATVLTAAVALVLVVFLAGALPARGGADRCVASEDLGCRLAESGEGWWWVLGLGVCVSVVAAGVRPLLRLARRVPATRRGGGDPHRRRARKSR